MKLSLRLRFGWLLLALGSPFAAAQTIDLIPLVRSLDGPRPLTVSPSATSAGGFISLSPMTITNAGDRDSPAFRVSIYLSRDANVSPLDPADVFVTSSNVPSLRAGGSSRWDPGELPITSSLAPGSYIVGVVVDDRSQVAESDETNNTLVTTRPLVIRAPVHADLAPGSVILKIGDNTYGETIEAIAAPQARVSFFNWSVSNAGTDPAESFVVGFYLSTDNQITRADHLIAERFVSGVPAGSFVQSTPNELSFDLPSDFGPELYYVGVLVDAKQQVAETSVQRETNNARSAPLRIRNVASDRTRVWRAQLRLTTATTPNNAATGDDVYISVNPDHQVWLDYARNDFERGDAFTYDIPVDGIQTFGDFQDLKIAKEGTDGWCIASVDIRLNERVVFEKIFAPTCGWIDAGGGQSNSLQLSYADLRSNSSWRSFITDIPARFTKSDLESMLQAIVGDQLKLNGAYWDWQGGDGVTVTAASPTTLHATIRFTADVNALPDPTIFVDFDVSPMCTCGEITFSLSNFSIAASSSYYPSWFKDRVAKEIADRMSAVSDSLNLATDLDGPICPVMPVLAAPPMDRVEFNIPPFAQDLTIKTVMIPGIVRPGDSVRVASTVLNLGNQNSGQFGTDVYLFTGPVAPVDLTAAIASSSRLGGSTGHNSAAACGSEIKWDDFVRIPPNLSCSVDVHARRSVSSTQAPSLGSPSSQLPDVAGNNRYWLITALSSSAEPASPNNNTISSLDVSLPDVALEIRAPGATVVSRNLKIAAGNLSNRGGYDSNPLEYVISLANSSGSRVIVARGTLPSLLARTQVQWGGFGVPIPSSVSPGTYNLAIEITQAGGGPECDLANNVRTFPISVN